MPDNTDSADEQPPTFAELLTRYSTVLPRPSGESWHIKTFAFEAGGVSIKTAQNWCSGRNLPPPDTFEQIKQALFGDASHPVERRKLEAAYAVERSKRAAVPKSSGLLTNISVKVPLHFVGRDEALKQIDAGLRNADARVAITALHGLKGVGKTTLAAAYAVANDRNYALIWWIDAEQEQSIRRSLIDLGVRRRWVDPHGDENANVAAVLTALGSLQETALLIFDNAIGPDGLRQYLPVRGGCKILITSNNHAWGALADKVEIEVWPPATGADYLLRRTGRGNGALAEALELAEELGGLPLALEQASAYCEQRAISFGEYSTRFQNAPIAMLEDARYASADYHNRLTVAKTFALGIGEAAKLSALAADLIFLAALLAPLPIPLFLFVEGLPRFSLDSCEDAVSALRAFALVDLELITDSRETDRQFQAIRLHRLVRMVAAETQGGSEAKNRGQHELVEAMDTVYPGAGDVFNDHRTWPTARCLDGLFDCLLSDNGAALNTRGKKIAAGLSGRVSSYRQRTGVDTSAITELCKRSLYLCREAYGDRDTLTARLHNDFAIHLHERVHDLTGAFQHYERALLLNENLLGSQTFALSIFLGNFARVLHHLRMYPESKAYYGRALKLEERFAYWHESHAALLTNYATLSADMGDHRRTRRFFRHACQIPQETAPETITFVNLLGSYGQYHLARGLKDDAIAMFRQQLAACIFVFGHNHYRTAETNCHLAGALRCNGDRSALDHAIVAKDYYDANGLVTKGSACAINALALVHQMLDETDKAVELFEEGLQAFEKATGKATLDYAQNLENLANVTPDEAYKIRLRSQMHDIRSRLLVPGAGSVLIKTEPATP